MIRQVVNRGLDCDSIYSISSLLDVDGWSRIVEDKKIRQGGGEERKGTKKKFQGDFLSVYLSGTYRYLTTLTYTHVMYIMHLM